MSDEDSNVTKLPVNFKVPPTGEGPMLKIVSGAGACNHSFSLVRGKIINAQYLIREGETEVECSLCETKLDPMFVLRKLAHEETKWQQARITYITEMARLNERKATKCEHCSKMTRVSRR